MKKLFEPGQMVKSFTGQAGLVISRTQLDILRRHSREGKRPGHFFTIGECHDPDYIQEVPVAFEDGTFDVMKSTSIQRLTEGQDEESAVIQRHLDQLTRASELE